MLAETGAALREKAREAKFRAETIDVTEPGKAPKLGAKHPITVTIEEISKFLNPWDFHWQKDRK